MKKNRFMPYLRMMRIDHWIKQLFILPGTAIALLLAKNNITSNIIFNIIVGFAATCFIASANYMINEWLDRGTDKYHPTKKQRPAVSDNVKGSYACLLWLVLTILGMVTGYFINRPFLTALTLLWIMGIVYNVKPLRTKDIPFLDVLTESVNNALRFLLGWFIITAGFLPPSSIILGYWMAGAFLMTIKRFAEYRMIDDKTVASLYRKSFRYYSERSLLISAFFYAMLSIFFSGIFLIKYRVELILFMPFFMGLFCYYFYLSFKEDSSVQKPEKLYHEKGLMAYCLFLLVLFIVLLGIRIPGLDFFVSEKLVKL